MTVSVFQSQLSLKTKLSMIVAIAVMLVVTALGFYFDGFIRNGSLENAHNRIVHGYQRLAYKIKNIEDGLKSGIDFIQSDERMIASIELVNNYQDKNNYDSFLLDEEKKFIVNQLLERVKFSFNNNVSIYDKNDELVAYVSRKGSNYELNYVSYEKSEIVLFNKSELEQEYSVDDDLESSGIVFQHIHLYRPEQIRGTSFITYHHVDEMITITSHRMIIDEGTGQTIGHIEMSNILDQDYFKQVSEALGLEIKALFYSDQKDAIAMLDDSVQPHEFDVIQSKSHYSAVLKQDSLDGEIYYSVNLDKTHINNLLNQSRIQFLIIFLIITISILLLMRYIINNLFDLPLSILKNQVQKIEHQDYSESKPALTGDELEAVSININRLALVIQQRETSLKKSMLEQNKLSTKVKENEVQLRTLIQTLPDLVWLKDADGVYLTCNPKFELLYGAKETDIVGKTDYDFVDKELADFFRENDKNAMHAGKPTMNEEEVEYASDGHKELLETIKTPMYASDGTVIGVLGVGRDITSRRQIEEELRRSQKMDAIGQLTGGIAHDFNNLLGIMLGNLELLELTSDNSDNSKQSINDIRKAALRAADLTKQLLSFSSRNAAMLSVININPVIINMKALIERSLTPEVDVELLLGGGLWMTEIDIGDLEDCLLNLSLNARDAMSGRGHLTIGTKNVILDNVFCEQSPSAVPGEYVELSVQDTGEGISKEQIDHIFEPFFTTKEQGKGTGLGLAMIYGFVNRSKGCVKCESELGVGTTFQIYLPRSLETDLNNELNHDEEPYETISKGNETILVVDDELGLLKLAQQSLEILGYHVLVASDGVIALDVLKENPEIDLLFSDIVMPNGVNGYELAEQVTNIRSDFKVLLTSGYTEKVELQSSQQRFTSDLLKKPYTQAELSRAIRTALDGKEAQ